MQAKFDLGAFAVFRGVAPDKAQALKPLEEAAEVFGAWQDLDVCSGTYRAAIARGTDRDEVEGFLGGSIAGYRQSVVDELADVCQATCNLLAALHVDGDEWASAVGRCQARNLERGRY